MIPSFGGKLQQRPPQLPASGVSPSRHQLPTPGKVHIPELDIHWGNHYLVPCVQIDARAGGVLPPRSCVLPLQAVHGAPSLPPQKS